MDKEQAFIILASQEFQSANHRNLWIEIARQSSSHVYVANIMADYVTSVIRQKYNRLQEAKTAPKSINDHLTLFRPLVIVRPEILPDCMFPIVRNGFWNSMKRVDPDIMNKYVNLIVYNAYWVKILKGSHPCMKIGYYLFDEVRLNGKDGSINKTRYRHDEYACIHSDVVYTMTKVLAESRAEYNNKIYVMGNGSILPSDADVPRYSFLRSVAFIGNFRDWVDEVLLENIVRLRPNFLFAFAGPVEVNMRDFLAKLLDKYNNTIYMGKVSKDRMTQLYRMFDVVIIPYKINQFIQASRPIKIVESILSGVPVVTIPMDGYDECEFIRFASNEDEFVKQIDYLFEHPINKESQEYLTFCFNNTWQQIAQRIIKTFEDNA